MRSLFLVVLMCCYATTVCAKAKTRTSQLFCMAVIAVITGTILLKENHEKPKESNSLLISDYFKKQEDLHSLSTNQVSFSVTDTTTTISEVVITFYTDTNCSNSSSSITLGPRMTPAANHVYSSSAASNFLLCQNQTGSHTGNGICTPSSSINSIGYSFTYKDIAFSASNYAPTFCVQQNFANSCTPSNCGYSTSINAFSLTPLEIFVSTGTSTGLIDNTSPIAAADNLCQQEAIAHSISGTYAAMIAGTQSDGATSCRQACSTVNGVDGNPATNCVTGGQPISWILKAYQVYVNYVDKSFLFATNNAGVTDGSYISLNTIAKKYNGNSQAPDFWTGLNLDWTTDSSCLDELNNASWRGNSNDDTGGIGTAGTGVNGWWGDSFSNCSDTNNFFCVKQSAGYTRPSC